MNEPRLKFFSRRFDINLVALWVGKERASKPPLQLFITLDQKACLIPELRFPIPTLLNEKKVIFLPPVDISLPKKFFFYLGETGRNGTDLLWELLSRIDPYLG